jgi:phenylalanyl-tRNA synthetase beta chain
MYLSLNWVKNWLKLPSNISTKDLGLALTMSTVEVEGIEQQAEQLRGIVLGQIVELAKHPQADLLQVCQVNIGKKTEQIVCGGTNLRKGMLVAVATVGSRVKWHGQGDWVALEPVKIRGVESQGMIVSVPEIGISNLFNQTSEKEILDLSDFTAKPGQDLSQVLELNDVIIDIDNKSINHRPDLWGQYGLARELAAIYKLKLTPYQSVSIKGNNKSKVKVSVQNKDCYRYSAVLLNNIKVAESPWWLKVRLQSVGVRPINNVVDITNYVMYELGQPLHAFDAKQVSGHNIVVTAAKKAEKFITLDGVKRKLSENVMMIGDGKKYLAIAGIMGGQNSEISSDTTEVLIESANFKASSIRRASQFLNLRSESSTRFEKSLDPELTILALNKVVEMLTQVCPQAEVISEVADVNNNPFTPITLEVSEQLINDRFGVAIPSKEIINILQRLQFEVVNKKGKYTIHVPSFRATKDISIPEDIVEEVARIYGYDKIPLQLPKLEVKEPIIDVSVQAERDIKQWLAFGQGYDEVYSYSFTDQTWANILNFDMSSHIKVKNAISPEQAYLNKSLLPNLLNMAQSNWRWYDNFKIFELQRIFDKKEKSHYYVDQQHKKYLPQQAKHLAGVQVASQAPDKVFFELKGLFESLADYWGLKMVFEATELPYASFAYSIVIEGTTMGVFGILQTDLFSSTNKKVSVGFWDLDFSNVIKHLSQSKKFQILPKFPSVNRDMAIVIERRVQWQDILETIYKTSALIKNIDPFDVFMGKEIGEDKKSLAFHLEFRSDDRTLLAEDIDKIMKDILAVLASKFEARLR